MTAHADHGGMTARWTLALVVGLPVAVLVTGAFYSLSGIHGGNYGAALALTLAHGALLWMVFRLGGGRRVGTAGLTMLLAVGSLGPPVVGHAIGYGDLQAIAYRMVQADTGGRYPAAWKRLDREALFPHWVGHLTGRAGGGAMGYLRARADVGWDGRERINRASTRIERTGVWVWLAWAWHLVFFLVAVAVAYFAALRPPPTPAAAVPVRSAAPPVRADASTDGGGLGPADRPQAGQWSHYEERDQVLVSFGYQPRAAYPTLRDFFEAQVRADFAPHGAAFAAVDLRNYLERVCVWTALSREELARFIDAHRGPTPTREVPRLPERVVAAFQFRDDPATQAVVWETEQGYWRMAWNQGDARFG